MKIQINNRAGRESGYSALFITLVLVAATVLVMGATLSRTTTGVRLSDRNCNFIVANGAAEAAVEKVLARVMVDFANYGEGQVISNLSFYQSSLLPTTTENSYWSNFVWSDGQGNANQIYVGRTTVGTNAPYIALEQQYTGLSGYASTYRILANVTMTNTAYNYGFTNAVQQDVQLAQIPVFQFAIFYNGLLEFSDAATMTVTGPVHANSNVYVGSPSALTFNSIVTTTGNITKPSNLGMSSNSWTGAINYNATPAPGYLTGQPSLTLPIGTNSTSGTNVQQIIYPPPAGESYNSPMGQQRYYNKAHMVLYISNSTYTAIFKSAPGASSYTFTNTLANLTNNAWQTNASWMNTSFISVTNTFFDWREGKTVYVTQIDVNKMTNWMAGWLSTNTNVSGMFSTNNPFNIIYIADWRYSNSSSQLSAVRLMKGTNLPPTGLTVATPNPLYIWGNYNVPNMTYPKSTNTTLSAPASVICDAITLLSPAWTDAASLSELNIDATDDTVNTAIIAGIVPSTGTTATTFSGGAMNLTRLLEKWTSSDSLYLNTSIVCLYNSTWANTPYQLSGNYFTPPTRFFAFDQNYMSSAKLPPGTPKICRLIRATWCNPPPGTISYAPSPTLDFVAQ